MAEGNSSIYSQCSAMYNDTSTHLDELLQCISGGHEKKLASETEDLAGGVDAFFLIFAGALVYFMQTGFAMLCAGSIRSKNVKNVILWNLLDSCGGGLAFWATGYAFAYGGDNDSTQKTFVGTSGFFFTVADADEIRFENWFFQFAFACALSSIVAGTIAERTQMKAYLLYSVFLVGFVYPVVAHAFWSTNGWLSPSTAEPLWGSGAIDLAGSGPVHMTGGVTALAAALILGPRKGRFFDEQGIPLDVPTEFPPHSVALQFLGTFCLWFGWYGFNPGSVFFISSTEFGNVAALVAVNTTLAACAGAVSAMFTSTIFDYFYTGIHTYDLGFTMNGCLTGLVAITAGCATVDTWAAVVIGIIAGWVYLGGSKLLIRFKIDDAVDAIPVHCCGGAWGVLATGLFTKGELLQVAYGTNDHIGWFYEWGRGSGNFTLMGIQIIAVLFVFGWSFIVMGIFYTGLNMLGWLRIDPLEEEVGMDISRHKGSAYDISPVKESYIRELESTRQLVLEDRSNRSGGSSSRHKRSKQSDDTSDPAPIVEADAVVTNDVATNEVEEAA